MTRGIPHGIGTGRTAAPPWSCGGAVNCRDMQPTQRVRLSTGMTTPIKIFVSVIALFFALGGIVFAAFAWGIGAVSDSVTGDGFAGDDPFGTGDGMQSGTSVFSAIVRAMGLCGLPFVLLGVYLLVYAWRSAIWLDATVVSKRGAFLTRRADLATAEVRMGNVSQSTSHHHGPHEYRTVIRIPALVATDAQTRRTVKIPLRGQGLDLLPPHELQALAAALSVNSSAGAERARAIAAHLNAVAADPLAA
jgi:hypothetical protein